MDKIANYVGEVLRTANLEALNALTFKTLQDFGFDKFSYLGFNARQFEQKAGVKDGFVKSTFVQTTYPDQWVEHYTDKNYFYIDPMIQRAKASLLPFKWDSNSEEGKGSRAAQRFFRDGKDYGINRGVVIPVHAPGGEFATLALATDESEKELDAMWKENVHVLHLLGIYYHASVWEKVLKRQIEPTPALSPREMECLQWAARGKTLWEVSKILGISEATGKTHLRSAMEKLGTFNKAHAVSKALVHGLITI